MLLFGLMITALIVQARAFTVAEVVSQTILLGLGIKYGVGGMQRLYKVCYVWLCLTDLAAITPTIIKNWRLPGSDSPLWFGAGVVASILSALAAKHYTVTELMVLVYLAFANLLAFIPLLWLNKTSNKPSI